MTASVVWADDLLGGDIIYRAVDAAATKHLPVSSVWNTWFSARFASADRKLPIYRKFALGGRRSFYGLSDHEMLGDKLFATSVGLRWKAYSRSYLFGRADIGTVWGHNDRIDFWRDLRVGFGGGLAFDTPLGPLEISGGIAEGDASQFYFHWGYEF